MFKIVDGRLHSGVLTAHSSKRFTLFAFPISLAEAALLGQDVVNKQFVKAGGVRRAVEAAIKTHSAEIRKQFLRDFDHRYSEVDLTASPHNFVMQYELVLIFRNADRNTEFHRRPALPFEIHHVCGSKMENTFSFCGIVSPLRRRRSIWSICRTACMTKYVILLIFWGNTPFAANSRRSALTRPISSAQRSRYALISFRLARRILRILLNLSLRVFSKCIHWRHFDTSCFEPRSPAWRSIQRIASHSRLTSVG